MADIILVKEFAAVLVIVPALILFYMLASRKKESATLINRYLEKTNNALVPMAVGFFLLFLANVFELADYLGTPNAAFRVVEVLSLLLLALGEWYFLYTAGVKRK